jgi:hypothetical protein
MASIVDQALGKPESWRVTRMGLGGPGAQPLERVIALDMMSRLNQRALGLILGGTLSKYQR